MKATVPLDQYLESRPAKRRTFSRNKAVQKVAKRTLPVISSSQSSSSSSSSRSISLSDHSVELDAKPVCGNIEPGFLQFVLEQGAQTSREKGLPLAHVQEVWKRKGFAEKEKWKKKESLEDRMVQREE